MARERYDPMTGTWSRSSSERYEEESARKRSKPRKKSSKKRKTTKRRKSTNRRATVAKRRRRKSVGAGVKTRKRRGGKRRASGRVVRRRSSGRRSTIKVRRRRRRGSRGFSTKGILGQLMQAGKDGAWTVAGDVAANMAQIMSGQQGAAGVAVQIAGGFAAGYVVSKYVDRDAGRFVMAGAAAAVVKKLVTDNVITALPAGTLKTNITAALQGYPHVEYAAGIQGYVSQTSPDAIGLPMGFGVGQGNGM